jgi:sulfur-carrier protein adenylyltransferase/sulfurtransferase
VANCSQAGVLGVLPGVLGALQATEAIKLITGVGAPLIGRLLTYDALAMRFEEFRVTREKDCPVCGESPTIREVRPTPGTSGIRRLSAQALNELLQRGAAASLIDVREVREFSAGHLSGSINIPLGQLGQQLTRIAPDSAPIFICRSGGRSLAACQLALQANIASPANLEGGLLAWSSEVDPQLYVL